MSSAHKFKASPYKSKLLVHQTIRLLVIVIVLAGTFGSGSSTAQAASWAPQLTRYPYLTDVVNSFATVNFATDRSQTTALVRYGKSGVESCTAHTVTATRNNLTVSGVLEYQWKAILRVEPGVAYCYRPYLGTAPEVDLLGSDAAPVFNAQLPAGSADAFSFIIMGDWGYVNADGTNPIQAALLATVANSGARFAVTVGDNVYPTQGDPAIPPGQTQYGDLNATGMSTSAVFGPNFWTVPGKSIPLFPAIGNHGFSQAAQPQNHPHVVNFPEENAAALSGGRYTVDTYCCVNGTTTGSYASVWYAIDAGLARIYVLEGAWADSNAGAGVYQTNYEYFMAPGTPHWEWLKADLASHPAAVKVALFHYPMYSDSTNEPPDTYLQGVNALEGLMNQYNVQLLFSGHGHFYQRNNKPNAISPITYIVGGGGAYLTALGANCSPWDAFAFAFTGSGGKACGAAPVPTAAEQVHHVVKVTVNAGMVTVEPINAQGNTFDVQTYDFTAGKEGNPPSVPGSLSAANVGGDSVQLNWGGSSDASGVRGYTIYRNGVLWDYVTGTATSYVDNRAFAGGSYSYQVDAFDIWGNHSGLSNTAVPGGTPPAVIIYMPVIMK